MFTAVPYLIEILTPMKEVDDPGNVKLKRFEARYRRVIGSGCAVSIPDNPMGNMRLPALGALEHLDLPVDPEKLVVNLNTFHTKEELDAFLKTALQKGVRYLLIVRGDGSPELPKLQPEELDIDVRMVTTVELLEYINRKYGGSFITGGAFNQYKPIKIELQRMERKIVAGAKFIITQPVIGKDPNVDLLRDYGIPFVVEAWMSKNTELLFKSVGIEKDANAADYDPVKNLYILHETYPDNAFYLSLLSFKTDWEKILPGFT